MYVASKVLGFERVTEEGDEIPLPITVKFYPLLNFQGIKQDPIEHEQAFTRAMGLHPPVILPSLEHHDSASYFRVRLINCSL